MKIAIVGYGNLGKSLEKAALTQQDTKLVAIFSRRALCECKTSYETSVYPFSEIVYHKNEFDVVLNCMGSANDLPVITPYLSKYYNVIDCFEGTSNQIKSHCERVTKYAEIGKKTAIVNCGFNSTLFRRLINLSDLIFSNNEKINFKKSGYDPYFTNAIKCIDGVADVVVILTERGFIANGNQSNNLSNLKCYISLNRDTNKKIIFDEILGLSKNFNIKKTDLDFSKNIAEFKLKSQQFNKLELKDSDSTSFTFNLSSTNSNCIYELTANIMLNYASVAVKLNNESKYGCMTPFDIADFNT